MGRKGYGQEVKLRAKALWVTGKGTDAEIAETLGISRAETVGEWRRAENWDLDRKYIKQITDEQVSQAVAETISDMNSRLSLLFIPSARKIDLILSLVKTPQPPIRNT